MKAFRWKNSPRKGNRRIPSLLQKHMKLSEAIESFRNREIKAKDAFDIRPIAKGEAYGFVAKYYYLGTAKFMSMYQYGMFLKGTDMLLGVATFAPPQGPSSLKGWFGITDNSATYVQELTRLCLLPELNGSNATSFLLSNSMKRLKALGGKPSCCGGSLVVHDDRYDEWFTCPKCTSKFVQLTEEEAQDILKNHNGDRNYVEGIIGRKSAEGWLW